MIREKLIQSNAGRETSFRWRGHEISRIEGFSDAVFGFAITLLVVSLEVPKTSTALLEMMRGFFAFGLSFFLLFHVWFHQYKFFRRYGLQDNYVLWLNAVLLFVVLFFIYPLKFLFSFTVNQFTGISNDVHLPNGTIEQAIKVEHAPPLMIIYGLGFAAVFCLFALLNYHAYRKRVELELSELEVFDTCLTIQQNILNVVIGLISILIVLVSEPRYAGLAGSAYFLIVPVLLIHKWMLGKRRRKLRGRFEETTSTV